MKCFISLINEKKEQSYEQNGESKIMGSLSFSLLRSRSLSRHATRCVTRQIATN